MDEYIRKQDASDAVIKHLQLDYEYAWGVREAINGLLAADVVPVVRGEWEHHMSFGICDKCGYEYNWTGTDAKNYCPNCGAKMDGGKNT